MIRLQGTTTHLLPKDVVQPHYDRSQVKAGIVHLGIGAFHRAHQAIYTEAVLNQFGGDWGIIGCSLRSPAVRDQMAPQDNYYTLVERSGEGERLQLIGAVINTLVGPEDPETLVAIMADPTIRIVSLTVTEKGYCHNPATGDLNFSHPDIIHDLENLHVPKSAIGFLVAALNARYQQGAKSFTAMSCDNLPDNGALLKKVTLQFAEKVSPSLANWISASTCFPGTMVDRIVPATTEADKEDLEGRLGMRDEALVVAEPFSQWVIEDCFSDGRPQWEAVGAQLVDDVRIFEKIKLRLLNGAHSTLAYTGYLAGFTYISEVMEEPAFVNMITRYMAREAGETLTAPSGFNIEQYKVQLRQRFFNPALKHRTWQIAMDGSQKLPQRLLQSLREQLAGAGHIDIICLAIAAWIRYVSGVDEKGSAIEVSDPLAAELRSVCDTHQGNTEAMVRAMVALPQIFGSDLKDNSQVIERIRFWLDEFYQRGVLHTIRHHFTGAEG